MKDHRIYVDYCREEEEEFVTGRGLAKEAEPAVKGSLAKEVNQRGAAG